MEGNFADLLRQAAGQPQIQQPQAQFSPLPQIGMAQTQQPPQMDMFGQSNTPSLSRILGGMRWPGQI